MAVEPAETLREDRVHLWRISLDRDLAPDPVYAQILSAEERDQSNHFHFERDRRRYRVAHTALRLVLSYYLNTRPQEVQFTKNQYGKPYLTNNPDLFFNLSHAHEMALLAVASKREVGVDVELIRPELAEPAVIRHYFAPAEARALAALPEDRQVTAFFHIWTRKEAYIKARGMGLSLPLDQFEVSLHPAAGEVDLKTGPDPAQASLWSIRALQPAPGYVAAIAAHGKDWLPVEFQWDGALLARFPAADRKEGL